MAEKKKIIIIGAGPGGLAAGMLLASRNFEVHIFEKEKEVGGRNGSIKENGFSFDVGPTFLMMKFILDEVFEECGKQSSDYLDFVKLYPMYRLFFKDVTLDIVDNDEQMANIIETNFKGESINFYKFLKKEKIRYSRMYPCLQKSYDSFFTYFHYDFLKAIPHLSLGKSMYQELSKYYKNESLKMAFTFQSKYLGMSPWTCPAAFMMIPYIEHSQGIYHVKGGLSQIPLAMAKVFEELGGKIYRNTKVKEIIVEKGIAKGVKVEPNETFYADEIIVNADFGYSVTNLFPKECIKKYSEKKLEKKLFSCSTFMLYLGLDKTYDLPHHNIIFSKDYKKYINDIADYKDINEDVSIYVRNASVSDETIAPSGFSNMYILVPVANNRSKIHWEEKKDFRNIVLKIIEERCNLNDLEKHIVFEKKITPNDWEAKYNIYLGATFNLGHNLMQMLYFRPHNRFEEVKNCYLVGGGTHPGSGLPTIYESGRITANLISKKYGVKFLSKNLQIG